MKKSRYITHCLLGTLMLMFAGCGREDYPPEIEGGSKWDKDSEMSTYNLRVETEGIPSLSRAGIDEDVIFSNGSMIDKLIYAVYLAETENGKTTYTLQSDFSDDPSGRTTVNNPVFPMEIEMQLKRGNTYRIVFWAQSSKTNAYNVDDLEKIVVDYEGDNNDESRDAFTASEEIVAGGYNKNYDVILRRPFAQINVGTTGWDYEGKAVLRPNQTVLTRSKIVLEGVGKYYNAVEKRTLTQEELGTGEQAMVTATFDYAVMPAFVNVDESQLGTQYTRFDKETFLQVDLDKDGKYADYIDWEKYDEIAKQYALTGGVSGDLSDYIPATEQFKYLSMCYILPPSTGSTGKSVLDNVYFYCQGVPYGSDNSTSTIDNDTDTQLFRATNVPVQTNWRTNLLSNSFYVVYSTFRMYVVPDFYGDFNRNDGDWLDGIFDADGNLVEWGGGNINNGFRDPGEDYMPDTAVDDTSSEE